MNWKSFSKLDYDVTVDAVVVALDLEIPDEGRPRCFKSGFTRRSANDKDLLIVQATDVPGIWVLFEEPGVTCLVSTDDLVKRANKVKITKGTSTGDAFRRWLALWTRTN